MKNLLIIYKDHISSANLADKVIKATSKICGDISHTSIRAGKHTLGFTKQELGSFDFIIAIGGDGALLYAAALFQELSPPPILSIFHGGTVGFLMEFRGLNRKTIQKFLALESKKI